MSREAIRVLPLRTLPCWLVLLAVVSVTPIIADPGVHHAIKRMTDAIAEQPELAALYVGRAYYLRLNGQYDEALDDLQRAEGLDPQELRVAVERGFVFSAMGRDEEAEAELTRFLSKGQPMAGIHAERARIHARNGRVPLAIADYDSAIALRPDVGAYLERGRLQLQQGDLDGAAAGYRDGLKRFEAAVPLRLELIEIEKIRGNFDTAAGLIRDELERAPVKTDWQLELADVLDAAGRPDEALAVRNAALGEANQILQTRRSSIHVYTRAKVYAALGRVDDAKRDLERALAKSPRFVQAQELLTKLETHTEDKRIEP